jgi:hypothetical protein
MEDKPSWPLFKESFVTVQYGDADQEEEKTIMHGRRRKKHKNWLENKVSISIDGEEYKQEAKVKINQDGSKESYDNILIMESTDSLATKEPTGTHFPLLDKHDNVHVNWSEVDEEDAFKKGYNTKLDIPEYRTKNDTTIDPRGSHEVIIEQIEEEKQLIQKQNLRYKYLQAEECKIIASNKRSRRKSLNDAYWTPLMMRSDICLDIRINEMGVSPQSYEKFIHSQRERREQGREIRNQRNLLPIHANSEDDFKQYRTDDYLRDFKTLSARRKEEYKSNSDTHSPFASFTGQTVVDNPINDYGKTWTCTTLAPPCDTDFWENQEIKRNNSADKDEVVQIKIEDQKYKYEENKVKDSISDITRHIKLTYLSASSLSDDRWICPICLDIFDDAIETPWCHNLFCEKCIIMAHAVSEMQIKQV